MIFLFGPIRHLNDCHPPRVPLLIGARRSPARFAALVSSHRRTRPIHRSGPPSAHRSWLAEDALPVVRELFRRADFVAIHRHSPGFIAMGLLKINQVGGICRNDRVCRRWRCWTSRARQPATPPRRHHASTHRNPDKDPLPGQCHVQNLPDGDPLLARSLKPTLLASHPRESAFILYRLFNRQPPPTPSSCAPSQSTGRATAVHSS